MGPPMVQTQKEAQMADRDRPLYAVLIDADNIPAKFAAPILKEITTFGEPALRRVYGDWSSGRLSASTSSPVVVPTS